MKKNIVTLFLFIAIGVCKPIFGQHKTENVVIVTLDGMRWQEVFGGIDTALVNNRNYTQDKDGVSKAFGADDMNESRKKLFPFFWGTIASQGQLYGNKNIGNSVSVANRYRFSYPGYNEIFTGYPDTSVNSNDKILNKNTNVLEFINKQNGYAGKVAVFSTWDVFPYILNKWRSGIYVNSDVDTLKFANKEMQLINDMQFLEAKPIDVRLDLLTYFAGREYLKAYQPKVLYIAFDETDDFAHGGMYDQYIKSAHAEDGMLADLWKTLQSMDKYKDKTTLIVLCDHGRGDKIKDEWRDHGQKILDAGNIWIAAIGPDTKSLGEMKTTEPLYQKQIAATIAKLLGFDFTANHPIAKPIESIYKK